MSPQGRSPTLSKEVIRNYYVYHGYSKESCANLIRNSYKLELLWIIEGLLWAKYSLIQQICASYTLLSPWKWTGDKNPCPHGTYIPSFNNSNTILKHSHRRLLLLFCRWGNWDLKKLSNLPEVIEELTSQGSNPVLCSSKTCVPTYSATPSSMSNRRILMRVSISSAMSMESMLSIKGCLKNFYLHLRAFFSHCFQREKKGEEREREKKHRLVTFLYALWPGTETTT